MKKLFVFKGEEQSSLTFLSQRSQLRSHLLQRVFQLRAASAFFVQSRLHVAILQGHRLDGRNWGHLTWALTLTLTLGLCSHGGQQILSTSPKQTLRHREITVIDHFKAHRKMAGKKDQTCYFKHIFRLWLTSPFSFWSHRELGTVGSL